MSHSGLQETAILDHYSRSTSVERAARLVLVVLLILVSGHPVLSNPAVAPAVYVLMLLVGTVFCTGYTSGAFTRRAAFSIAWFVPFFLLQWFSLGEMSWLASAHFLVKILLAGWVIDRLGVHFSSDLVRAVYGLCCISLVFYLLQIVVGVDRFPAVFSEEWTGNPDILSIGIHTVHLTDSSSWRNSGVLWEPGAFQGIINLALFFLTRERATLIHQRTEIGILCIALVTTFSTTGFVCFFAIVLFRIARGRTFLILKVGLLTLTLLVIAIAFREFEFLGAKISDQISDVATYDGFMPDRFGALAFDWHYIRKSPLLGNGMTEATRFADHPELLGVVLGHSNGLSNFVATLGVVGTLGYFILYWRRKVSAERVGLIVVVLILAFGQQFLNAPLFLGLPFLRLVLETPD